MRPVTAQDVCQRRFFALNNALRGRQKECHLYTAQWRQRREILLKFLVCSFVDKWVSFAQFF